MIQSKSFALPPSELNEFLLAEVGIQTNGLSLTVLSLLARMERDPWVEAGRLARLPSETAIAAMTAAVATSRVCVVPECDPGVVATRLVARLPLQPQLPLTDIAVLNGLAVISPPLVYLILWISVGVLLFATLTQN